MVRVTPAIMAIGLAVTALPAAAQGTPPESDGRYSFHKVEDGFLRLDTRTGQVSTCHHRSLGWACETVPDERAALESEIARLQNNNAALKKEMLANGLKLPDPAAPEQPAAKQEQGELKLPSQADVDRVVTFMERVWRRLVEMMNNVHKDVLGRT